MHSFLCLHGRFFVFGLKHTRGNVNHPRAIRYQSVDVMWCGVDVDVSGSGGRIISGTSSDAPASKFLVLPLPQSMKHASRNLEEKNKRLQFVQEVNNFNRRGKLAVQKNGPPNTLNHLESCSSAHCIIIVEFRYYITDSIH